MISRLSNLTISYSFITVKQTVEVTVKVSTKTFCYLIFTAPVLPKIHENMIIRIEYLNNLKGVKDVMVMFQ
jgi:hypothetical protein